MLHSAQFREWWQSDSALAAGLADLVRENIGKESENGIMGR
jgi:hypothetical protein